MGPSEVIDLIKTIPDVIWSGIVASALTFTGVLLSNGSNTKRLKIQLSHDAKEKQKERIANLRRETYLRVSEDMTKAMGYLGALPQHNFSENSTPSEILDLLASAAKLQLVAEPQTALLAGELASSYGELHFRLLSKIIPMQDTKIDIDINTDLYNDAQAEIRRLTTEISKLIESSIATEQNLAPLRNALQFHSSQAQKFNIEREQSWNKHVKLHFDFCRTLFPEIQAVLEKQNIVTIEIRKDLGLTTDIEKFQAQMKKHTEEMDVALNNILEQLEATLNSQNHLDSH